MQHIMRSLVPHVQTRLTELVSEGGVHECRLLRREVCLPVANLASTHKSRGAWIAAIAFPRYIGFAVVFHHIEGALASDGGDLVVGQVGYTNKLRNSTDSRDKIKLHILVCKEEHVGVIAVEPIGENMVPPGAGVSATLEKQADKQVPVARESIRLECAHVIELRDSRVLWVASDVDVLARLCAAVRNEPERSVCFHVARAWKSINKVLLCFVKPRDCFGYIPWVCCCVTAACYQMDDALEPSCASLGERNDKHVRGAHLEGRELRNAVGSDERREYFAVIERVAVRERLGCHTRTNERNTRKKCLRRQIYSDREAEGEHVEVRMWLVVRQLHIH